ncbi:riboflavin synthase [Litoribrevibacter albus]|uniref:Riboflavin synthase n=1 Tax=Litoribrevibacter albus TaxID=1473156 RepID=A0AA37W869_9GAMM|nr:riboflavin synthase [Litoribrevibacter albus]GLQ33445.1 riboflavin synthase subunit alpha [Litoribrevibacter albus]
MFTGIVEALGQLKNKVVKGGDVAITIAVNSLDMSDVKLGDSIAVNGVCLTVVAFNSSEFTADVSLESLSLTGLDQLAPGAAVNLEKAMLPTSRFGGHIVSGHVDGQGEIVQLEPSARSVRIVVRPDSELARYIAKKGSITLDGCSLTVNDLIGDDFVLNVIPHTQQETIIKNYKVGDRVNLEVDVVARYLERLLTQGSDSGSQPKSNISMGFLAEHGFIGRTKR